MAVESVSIIGVQSVSCRAQSFTTYVLSVNAHGGSSRWEVRRRYCGFLALHTQLKEAYSSVPPIPWKSLLGGSHAWVVSYRRKELALFLARCIDSADIRNDRDFLEFLGFRLQLSSPTRSSPTCGAAGAFETLDSPVSAVALAELRSEEAARTAEAARMTEAACASTAALQGEVAELDRAQSEMERLTEGPLKLSDSTALEQPVHPLEELATTALWDASRMAEQAGMEAVAAAIHAVGSVEEEHAEAEAAAAGSSETGASKRPMDEQKGLLQSQQQPPTVKQPPTSRLRPPCFERSDVGSTSRHCREVNEGLHRRMERLLAQSAIAEVKGHTCVLSDAGLNTLRKLMRAAERTADKPAHFRSAHAQLKLELLSQPGVGPAQMPAGAAWQLSQPQIQRLISTRPLAILHALQALVVAHDALRTEMALSSAAVALAEVARNGGALRAIAIGVAQTREARAAADGTLGLSPARSLRHGSVSSSRASTPPKRASPGSERDADEAPARSRPSATRSMPAMTGRPSVQSSPRAPLPTRMHRSAVGPSIAPHARRRLYASANDIVLE